MKPSSLDLMRAKSDQLASGGAPDIVHPTAAKSNVLGADAFSTGTDVHLGASPSGSRLLAHEAAHIVQQGAGSRPAEK